ncbi:MAG TPA: transposase [Blastocatellia bacterium]|nr:transposase [Blastocatellia bacterium]
MGDQWKKRPVLSKEKARHVGTPGWYSRGYVPHFSGEEITQTVTFRLFDSMPQTVLARWREELKQLPDNELDRAWRKRIDGYLDQGYGSCLTKEDRIAAIIQGSLLYSDGDRYRLHAWVVMPNHVHVLFTPTSGLEMGKIVHTWKSYTAHECNKALGRRGDFWRKEPFDRYIRDEQHFANAVAYIENNPVKAGLCRSPQDWKWSSAGYWAKAE